MADNLNSQVELDKQEKQAVSLYSHVKELAQMKYDSEIRREDSLITQSSHMQTAFSFMTAALFMALPIIIQYRGILSLVFILVAISSIVFFLLLSLLFASLAQRRVKKQALEDIEATEKFVEDNWETTLEKSQQLKQWVGVMSKVQKSLTENNDKRVTLIQWSMRNLWISIFLIVLWYFVAICKFL